MPIEMESYFQPENPLFMLAKGYFADLQAGDRRAASERILGSVAQGTTIADIYRHVFEPAQKELGRLWQINRMTIAQEHFCTAATQMIMCQLYPRILSGTKNGKVFVGASIPENSMRLASAWSLISLRWRAGTRISLEQTRRP